MRFLFSRDGARSPWLYLWPWSGAWRRPSAITQTQRHRHRLVSGVIRVQMLAVVVFGLDMLGIGGIARQSVGLDHAVELPALADPVSLIAPAWPLSPRHSSRRGASRGTYPRTEEAAFPAAGINSCEPSNCLRRHARPGLAQCRQEADCSRSSRISRVRRAIRIRRRSRSS